MAPPAGAFAETAFLNPSADATLFEVSPNNSAGGAAFFIAGTTQNRTRNRALLQFDIAGAIPAGAQITAVTLDVEVLRRPADGFEVALFGLHRVLRPWGEGPTIPFDNPGGLGAPALPGDATWTHRFAFTESWAAPGGAPEIDYVPGYSSSTLVYDLGEYQFEGTLDMIGDVQYWLNQPQMNFGWMMITDTEDLPFTARRFGSREDFDAAPLLTIEYTVVPEPRVVTLGGLGLLAFAAWRWRRSK